MKKLLRHVIIVFFAWISVSVPAFAANKVNTIDIQAVISKDGSMNITQSWDGSFEEGTESYIPMSAPDYLTISDLKVSDQNGAYETVPEWNIDWSFDEKARKCGVNYTDSGYEICFGISEYGKNHYTIEYKLDNVIGDYEDKDGVNFRFVNDQMNTTPTDVTVQIRLADGTPITDEIADIWAFGFSGTVTFEDGTIVARTEAPISAENYVTIMFAVDNGILSPSRQETGSFEEIQQKAFEGSDYNTSGSSEEDISFFEIVVFGLLPIALPIVLIIWLPKRKKMIAAKKQKAFSERIGYFREIPNGGNINVTYVLGRLFDVCEDGSILAVGMLRLIELGCLSPVYTQKVGIMGKVKENVDLQLLGSQHDRMNEFDEYLYTVLEKAAGPNGVLEARELESFAGSNDEILRKWINKCDSSGRDYLNQKCCLKRMNMPARLNDLTPSGEKELGELLGLKRYLEDFSLVAERGVKEIPVWRELLTYAMLFGIADKVAEQMKKLYPEISSQVVDYTQSVYTAYSYNHLIFSSMRAAEQNRELRYSGGGGFASFGGGGGSIGGSSGGGTR